MGSVARSPTTHLKKFAHPEPEGLGTGSDGGDGARAGARAGAKSGARAGVDRAVSFGYRGSRSRFLSDGSGSSSQLLIENMCH